MRINEKTPIGAIKTLDYPVYRKLYGHRYILYPPLCGKEFVHWRECKGIGQTVRLDDGFATEVTGYREDILVTFPFGSFNIHRKDPVLYGVIEEAYALFKIPHTAKAERLRFAARLAAEYIMRGERADHKVIGALISPKTKASTQIAVGKYNSEQNPHFRDMIMSEIREKLAKMGLNENFVIEALKDSAELAREAKDAKTLLAVSKEAEEYLGMKDQAKQESLPQDTVDWSHILPGKEEKALAEPAKFEDLATSVFSGSGQND